MNKSLKYTDMVDPTWSVTAAENFDVKPRPDSEDPVALELDGHCPRCKDHMQHTEFLIAFKGVTATSPDTLHETIKALRKAGMMQQQLLPAEFSVQCCCQVKHPDPLGRTGLTGCGATWKMRFESFEEVEK